MKKLLTSLSITMLSSAIIPDVIAMPANPNPTTEERGVPKWCWNKHQTTTVYTIVKEGVAQKLAKHGSSPTEDEIEVLRKVQASAHRTNLVKQKKSTILSPRIC